ncbi:hypothetical protein [Anaerosporobacter sp.]|uniref:hypothetical protein n=1 Tax=Anaerosporobacter sp. TaxID=1872529 RepID=UPI0028972062|nr:hypothetical protein [Anaerosporobacter sp.]
MKEGLLLNSLMEQADDLLYEDKKRKEKAHFWKQEGMVNSLSHSVNPLSRDKRVVKLNKYSIYFGKEHIS